MIPRRPIASTAAPLSPACVRVVLEGWAAATAVQEVDSGQLFELFLRRGAGVAQVWREHEQFLRNEAERLHVSPGWGSRRQYYFGEFLARDARDDHDRAS